MLTYSIKPRGGVVHALNLAEALAKIGHDVRIFALAKEKNARFFRPVAIPCTIYDYAPDTADYPTPEKKAVANVERMIDKYIEKLPKNCDIYHTQDCVGAVALNRLRRQGMKAPTVRTIHHVDIFNEYKLEKFQKESIDDCDVKLVVSKYWRGWLKENYGITAEITYNGINAERFSRANGDTIRKKLGLRNSQVILFIGGLEPRKGLEYLIFAMEQVIKRHPNAKLVAIARGGLVERGESAWFRMLIGRLRLKEQVKLIEFIEEEEVPQYYAAADVYVMPSRMEGWGIGLMEAMAAGKPVIATRAGGIPELVAHGKNGLLVEPGDISALAEALCQLLDSRKLRKKLGKNGIETVKKYSWEKTAKKTLGVYNNALRAGRGK
jgi:glycosyltransferase-like protein